MNPANPNSEKLLTLQEAAAKLAVLPGVLLDWNEHNILKPTITTTGEIGYTEKQIDQFAIIRRFDREITGNSRGFTSPISGIQAPNPNSHYEYIPKTTQGMAHQLPPASPSPKPAANIANQHKSNTFLILSSLTVVLFLIFVSALLIQQGIFKSALTTQQNQKLASEKGSQTSNLPISERVIVALPIQLNNSAEYEKANIDSQNYSKDKNIALKALYAIDNSNSSPAANQSLPAGRKIVQIASNSGTDSALYKKTMDKIAAITTYAQNSGCENENCIYNETQNENTAIDASGNIRGESGQSDVLATTLGGFGTYTSNNSGRQIASNSSGMLIFLAVSILAGFFVLQKQLASSMGRLQIAQMPTSAGRIDFAAQRILEVDQKMDGTVILIFQGSEYKICKPELYSESDRFIERLMALSGTDVKEMEYDSLKDGKIQLSSPLSRLVTRLGFVGIKRELFFPRTSKDRVLFRKYLTRNDLTAMGLTPEQVASELLTGDLQTDIV